MVEGQEVGQKRIRFAAADLWLEGVIHWPAGVAPHPAVAVCHPHPLHGGDMESSVVVSICEDLAEASIVALRFNFRGVGRSEGDYAEGIGEQDDVVAALDHLRSLKGVDPARIGLAGYSFGTRVALPVALRNGSVRAVALVSPFATDEDWERARNLPIPMLLLCGSADQHISCHKVQRLAGGLAGPSRCEIIPGADHFWWGYEGQVARKVADFFQTAFQAR
ncbi:MAG: alpha/beta fold hydrolase [Chloroflexi bacterium]|nr:alpha/beta fold hydrolase [Chloroflexota bacterium]